MDWKTGKMKDHDEIREELACYKIVIDRSGLLDKPIKYWAMFFSKGEPLFFEEYKQEFVDKMYKKITEVRNRIKKGDFWKNPSNCYSCGFNMRYGGPCDGGDNV